jgi:hypothetical protein
LYLLFALVFWLTDSSNRFGWVNASFQIGLTLLGSHAKRALGACIPPEAFFNATLADMELLMDEFGASPPVSPSHTDENPFNDRALLTPATAVLQDPFEKLNGIDLMTPAAEARDLIAKKE